ncbi:acyltransferase family protein [Spongiimicrobium salis]|uniref:acyltransferase family protein n=1 Tax=Spongiimicrobium salis TaxID=1667022 RepID=UPI00374D1F62
MRDTSASRNIGVDVLRGMAILMVILLHLNLKVPFKETYLGALLPKKWYSLFFWSGFYGVAMFFVISGYLITNSAIQKWGNLPKMSIKHFYLMRFARIIPLLTGLLLVLSILHLSGVPGFILNPEKTSLIRALFAALTFHFNWLEIQVGYLPANWDILWSLSIEEVFYLFFPVLCIFCRKEWHFVVLVSIFFIVSPWARTQLFPGNELGDRNHLAYIDAIAIGCMTALLAHRVKIPKKIGVGLLTVGWIFITFILFFRRTTYQWGLTKNGLYITVLAIGVGLVLLWMHSRHQSKKQVHYPIFRWLEHLGKHSYEIYLTHMFVIISLVALFKSWDLSQFWITPLYLLTIVFSLLLGKAIARYFTNPINRWLRKKWIP